MNALKGPALTKRCCPLALFTLQNYPTFNRKKWTRVVLEKAIACPSDPHQLTLHVTRIPILIHFPSFYLAAYLTFYVEFLLAFHLTYISTFKFHLTFYREFFLASILASYLIFYLTFYVTCCASS